MFILVKLLIIICLLIMIYQDIKERAIWWFLFPALLISAGYLHFSNSPEGMLLLVSMFNILILTIILSISFLYVQFKMKMSFFKKAFGTGDLLFFLVLTVAFPTVAFIVILVFSLIFSLALHLLISKQEQTVPLAGYSALFLIFVYSAHWTGIFKSLYSI